MSLPTVRTLGSTLVAGVLAVSPTADAATPATPGARVVTVVNVRRPWYAPRFLVLGKFRESVPQYTAIAGLEAKFYTLSRDGRHLGGIYLWRNRAAAEAWFNEAWFARVRRERGAPGEVRYFEVSAIFDPDHAGARDDGRAVATLSLSAKENPARPSPVNRNANSRAALSVDAKVPGLRWRCHVLASDGHTGTVSLWADADGARRAEGDTNGPVEIFDAPLVIRMHTSPAVGR